MKIIEYIQTLTKIEAAEFRKKVVMELGVSKSYSRHLCNGTRAIPPKCAFLFERLTGGIVTRFEIAPDHYPKQ